MRRRNQILFHSIYISTLSGRVKCIIDSEKTSFICGLDINNSRYHHHNRDDKWYLIDKA